MNGEGQERTSIVDLDVASRKLGEVDDASAKREATRSRIALLLIALFAVEVVGSLLLLACGWASAEDLLKILGVLVSPTVGLVGAATAFYYANEKPADG